MNLNNRDFNYQNDQAKIDQLNIRKALQTIQEEIEGLAALANDESVEPEVRRKSRIGAIEASKWIIRTLEARKGCPKPSEVPLGDRLIEEQYTPIDWDAERERLKREFEK